MRRVFAFCFACLLLSTAHADETIRYPRPESQLDHRNEYALELLKLALHEAGSNAHLIPTDKSMTQERLLNELVNGQTIDVMWSMTTQEREKRALAIRIPIYKGLIGWRLALVHASQIDLLSQVKSIDDLAQFSAGQARDWPDADILSNNHLKVITATGYENLFNMLGQGRFDYLPRAVGEIWSEADSHRADGLVVDPYIVIHYPAAVYFFVNEKNSSLANTLNQGLNQAIQNGKFDRLFYRYFSEAIEKARFNERRVIELGNPSLPADTPLDKTNLWLRLPKTSQSHKTSQKVD